jgi:hypothetical protein
LKILCTLLRRDGHFFEYWLVSFRPWRDRQSAENSKQHKAAASV